MHICSSPFACVLAATCTWSAWCYQKKLKSKWTLLVSMIVKYLLIAYLFSALQVAKCLTKNLASYSSMKLTFCCKLYHHFQSICFFIMHKHFIEGLQSIFIQITKKILLLSIPLIFPWANLFLATIILDYQIFTLFLEQVN